MRNVEEQRELTITLDVIEILKELKAESVWNDMTTLAVTPPVVHSTDEQTLRQLAYRGFEWITEQLSGYVAYSDADENADSNMWTVQMLLPLELSTYKDKAIRKHLECALKKMALREMYKPQSQVEELFLLYDEERFVELQSIRQILANCS